MSELTESRTETPEAINDERYRLLSKKYSGSKLSKKDKKRLKSLHRKIEKMMPRVTDQEIKALALIMKRMDDISAAVDRLLKKYEL